MKVWRKADAWRDGETGFHFKDTSSCLRTASDFFVLTELTMSYIEMSTRQAAGNNYTLIAL